MSGSKDVDISPGYDIPRLGLNPDISVACRLPTEGITSPTVAVVWRYFSGKLFGESLQPCFSSKVASDVFISLCLETTKALAQLWEYLLLLSS